MDAQKVDMFIITNGGKLPSSKIPLVQEKLTSLDDSRYVVLSTIQFKNPIVAFLLSFFLGYMGIGKFLTFGGLGIWAIIDLFLIYGSTKKQNYNKLQAYLN